MQTRAYAALCGGLGGLMVLVGALMFLTFFRYHAPNGSSPFPTGPVGQYFVAFSGCCLLAWGACLLSAVRRAEVGRAVGIPTAIGLVCAAVYRIAAWVVGDYVAFGNVVRIEAAIFLGLAFAFVWLRPRPDAARLPDTPAGKQA